MINEQQIYLLGQIQTCQIGGQSFSDRYLLPLTNLVSILCLTLCGRRKVEIK